MTLNCRFCGKPMFCMKTRNDRYDGKITGWFTCECEEFKENARKQTDFEEFYDQNGI